jgi:hypothetical protein
MKMRFVLKNGLKACLFDWTALRFAAHPFIRLLYLVDFG